MWAVKRWKKLYFGKTVMTTKSHRKPDRDGWDLCLLTVKNTMNGSLHGQKHLANKINSPHFFVAGTGSSLYSIYTVKYFPSEV
jgi:hypothetical protein